MNKVLALSIVTVLFSAATSFGGEPTFRAPIEMPGVPNSKYLIPEFADWDGDGDDDCLFGQQANEGAVSLYINSAGPGKTPSLSFKEHLKADGKQISLPSP